MLFYYLRNIMRLKFQERSELKFISRIIPPVQPAGTRDLKRQSNYPLGANNLKVTIGERGL
jgi:hypothetical protein